MYIEAWPKHMSMSNYMDFYLDHRIYYDFNTEYHWETFTWKWDCSFLLWRPVFL